MAKIKGLGTRIWYRKVTGSANPVCDLNIANGNYTDSASAQTAFEQAGYTRFACVFSIKPPGREFDLVEDEACLSDGEVEGFNDQQIYVAGDIVQLGKQCYEAVSGTLVNDDGDITTQLNPPPDATHWRETDCGCAYPSVELGAQQVNEMDVSNAYCPGDAETDEFEDACDDLFQFIYQYPTRPVRQPDGSFLCQTCAHTFCAKVRVFDPDEITPEEFMKVSQTLVRTSKYRRFCWNDPV